jgi:chitin disaccharide deacetylase
VDDASITPSGDRASISSLTSLIVNADDLGCSEGVNRGIVEAYEHGIVTSASLMVNRRAAVEAAAYARSHDEFDVGLHVELRHWRVPRVHWPTAGSERKLQARVARDVAEQLDRFRGLVGRDPTHLDSHQHRHRIDALRPTFLELAQELDVPLRHLDPTVRFCGDFYGQIGAGRPNPAAIAPEALIALLERLPPGVTELCSHPGYPEGLKAWYREERVQEVRTLCDARVREAIERLGISLITFRDLLAQRDSQTVGDQ